MTLECDLFCTYDTDFRNHCKADETIVSQNFILNNEDDSDDDESDDDDPNQMLPLDLLCKTTSSRFREE